MIKLLVIFPMVVLATIIGVGVYLQPNDLSECGGVVSSYSPCKKVDAIVAVSGGDTNARTDEAIRLYSNGWARYLILSGAAKDKTGPSNAEIMRSRAIANGVPAASIRIDEHSDTTKQNAENTAKILKDLRAESMILVTSGYHQKRASLEFSKSLDETTVLNSPVASDRDWSIFWWTTPHGWSLAISEISKIALFKVGIGQ